MPGLKINNVYGTKMSWLGSTRGLSTARTINLEPTHTAWAGLFVNGRIPAGTPVARTTAGFIPWTNAAGQDFVGHLAADIPADFESGYGVALMDTGRVIAAKVPGNFTPPTPERNHSSVVFA
jgi:hypothetical protein